MISRDIGIVICRVGAVLLFVQAIQGLVYSFETIEASGLGVADLIKTITLISAGPILGGLALWFLAEKICSFGAASLGSSVSEDGLHLERTDVVAAGIYVLGIYVITFAIVDAVQQAALSLYPRLYADLAGLVEDVPNPHGFSRQVGNVAQIILGIVLIIFGRRSR